MYRFSRKEFKDKFSEQELQNLFPATMFNKKNALKMVNQAPDRASVTLEYFSLHRGPKMLFVCIELKWWIQEMKLKGQIQYITFFDNLKQLEENRNIRIAFKNN